jgi:hypothetical protein
MDSILLPHLPRELAEFTGSAPPSYRRIYGLVLDGRVPAEQANGRWSVKREHLPMIAEALGMTAATRQSA